MRNHFLLFLLACLTLSASGCVERSVTILSEPSGARVMLDGEAIGVTPITVPFRHYGNHAICLTHEGYETLFGTLKLSSSWYQKPGLDFFSENVYPGTVIVERSATFTLKKVEKADAAEAEREAEAMKVRYEEFLRRSKQGK